MKTSDPFVVAVSSPDVAGGDDSSQWTVVDDIVMADKLASQSAASFSHVAKILYSWTCDVTSMKESLAMYWRSVWSDFTQWRNGILTMALTHKNLSTLGFSCQMSRTGILQSLKISTMETTFVMTTDLVRDLASSSSFVAMPLFHRLTKTCSVKQTQSAEFTGQRSVMVRTPTATAHYVPRCREIAHGSRLPEILKFIRLNLWLKDLSSTVVPLHPTHYLKLVQSWKDLAFSKHAVSNG